MFYRIVYFFLFLLFFFLYACEKQVVLAPENSEKKVVVEAMFTNIPFLTTVKLSKTKGINENILNHPKITDAEVKIIDKTTQDTIVFTSNNDGTYSTNISAIVGHQYKLEIVDENQTYTSDKTVLSTVSLNQIKSHPIEGTDKYYLEMIFEDDPNTQDFYLFICTNTANPDEVRIIVRSDYLYNTDTQSINIDEELFVGGEYWQVVMFHIDRENYEYLKIMNRAKVSLVNGAHPFYGISLGNPVSTVEGEGVLGYFIASTVSVSPILIGN